MQRNYRKASILTIAGSDPSGGAGIQADIKTAVKLGIYPCSVVSALTAQNTQRFTSCHHVKDSVLKQQLEAVLSDCTPQAVKIGLLCSAEQVDIVTFYLKRFRCKNIVVDPVAAPTLSPGSNDDLLATMTSQLFPLAAVITPNLPEIKSILKVTGIRASLLSRAIFIKGGHSDAEIITDILLQRLNSSSFSMKRFQHKRISTGNTHGSGCVLSSAIACYLAKGICLQKAVDLAIGFLQSALKHSLISPLTGNYGPALI